jgi:hypothetical protein
MLARASFRLGHLTGSRLNLSKLPFGFGNRTTQPYSRLKKPLQ